MLSRAAVEKVLDELVRPALQSDGGDITLVRVDGGDVFVRLVGSCSSCPSSIVTMRMGVERLLSEELPGFRQLVLLEAGVAE
jgi:Fe-S cluster biogenesis protein NfuA